MKLVLFLLLLMFGLVLISKADICGSGFQLTTVQNPFTNKPDYVCISVTVPTTAVLMEDGGLFLLEDSNVLLME